MQGKVFGSWGTRTRRFVKIVRANRFKTVFIIWAVAFSIAVTAGIRDNRKQTNDIQESRLHGCKQTYEGIREVFRPFFLPAKKQTPEQKADQAKFNRTVDGLIARCSKQVRTP